MSDSLHAGDAFEPALDDPATVLCVDPDPDDLARIEDAFAGDELTVRSETDPTAVPERLDGVDCLVSAYRLPGSDGLELLATVRAERAGLPFVLHSAAPLAEVGAELLSRPATDFTQKGESEHHATVLVRRVRSLVAQRRLETVTGRYRAALEACREALLVVAPDGTVAFANETLLSGLPSSTSVPGDRWSDLFTAESVTHLREEALPVAADGWSWTGVIALDGRGGTRLDSRTSLSRLDDGSMVFAFHSLQRADTGAL